MRQMFFICGIFLMSFSCNANYIVIDEQIAHKILNICKFVQAKGHPESLRLKGMAWCKVGVEYIPSEFKDQKQKISQLYRSEEYKELIEHEKFNHHFKQAKKRIAEISFGMH